MNHVLVEMESFDMRKSIAIESLAMKLSKIDLVAEAEHRLSQLLGNEARGVLASLAKQLRAAEEKLGQAKPDWIAAMVRAVVAADRDPGPEGLVVSLYSVRAAYFTREDAKRPFTAMIAVTPRQVRWIREWPASVELLLRSMMS